MHRLGILSAVLVLTLWPAVGGAYKISYDFFSPTGGRLTSAVHTIKTCNMQPYGLPTQADLEVVFNEAKGLQEEGQAFQDSLSFYDCLTNPSDPVCALLTDPNENYETAGFINQFVSSGVEAKLRRAIERFAYLYQAGHPEALQYLQRALRNLVSIYMVFADEFLIDALDYRFSTIVPNLDDYLDEQIEQLGKAAQYYQSASQAFISVWLKPIVGYDQIIGQLFTESEWDLFNLLQQRLSMAYREKGVRERVRLVKSDGEIKDELTQTAMELFIQATAMAQTLGDQFAEYGGDYILSALNLINKQIANINGNLNPLGYDERYAPLKDFASLLSDAASRLSEAATIEANVRQETREYEKTIEGIEAQEIALQSSYGTELLDLTGCDNKKLSEAEFALCVESAGGDLYDCSIDSDPTSFELCIQNSDSKSSVLAAKYRQIKDADLGLDRARLRYENLCKQIDYENAKLNYQIEVWKNYTSQQKELLDQYEKRMTGSYLVKKTKTEENVKDRKTGEFVKKEKLKSTLKTFTLRDDELDINLDKEKDLLDATLDFNIKMASDGTAVKNLMLEQADAMIAIDMAVNNQNMMIAAFDATMRQKENLLALWRRNLDYIEKYWTERLPVYRVIQSQQILQLAAKLNQVAHYSYLATKALEYKYMRVLDGVSFGTLGKLYYTDLFKCQTTYDFNEYLDKLESYDSLNFNDGDFMPNLYSLSVAIDILGLTNMNLGDFDLDGYVDAGGRSVDDVRYEKFQEFVNQHIDAAGNLVFTFTTSVYDNFVSTMNKANLKIWRGAVPGDPARTAKGLTVGIYIKGIPGEIVPTVTIVQKGAQVFLRPETKQVAEYYPIKALALLNLYDTSSEPYTQDTFTPLVNIDPRFTEVPLDKWRGSFTNRGIAANQWQVTLYRASQGGFGAVPLYKLKDIRLYFDAIGNEINF